MSRLAVLTYNHPHRKTQDLLMQLSAFGYNDVSVIALPWEDRKQHKPLVPHRLLKPLPIKVCDFVMHKIGSYALCYLPPVNRSPPGADYCYRPFVRGVKGSPDIEQGRDIVDLLESGGERTVIPG